MSARPLARVEDIPDGGAILADGEALILTRVGARVFAYRNRCPHAGHTLQRRSGKLIVQEGRYLLCAAHLASFALESGACVGGPCFETGLARMPIEVRDGAVYALSPRAEA